MLEYSEREKWLLADSGSVRERRGARLAGFLSSYRKLRLLYEKALRVKMRSFGRGTVFEGEGQTAMHLFTHPLDL